MLVFVYIMLLLFWCSALKARSHSLPRPDRVLIACEFFYPRLLAMKNVPTGDMPADQTPASHPRSHRWCSASGPRPIASGALVYRVCSNHKWYRRYYTCLGRGTHAEQTSYERAPPAIARDCPQKFLESYRV